MKKAFQVILGVLCTGFVMSVFLVGIGLAVPASVNQTFEIEMTKNLKPEQGEIGLLIERTGGRKRIFWKGYKNLSLKNDEKIAFVIFTSGAFPRDTEQDFIHPVVCLDKDQNFNLSFVVSKNLNQPFKLKEWQRVFDEEKICPNRGAIYQIKPTE